MWGQSHSYEGTVRGALADLAFIDARDDELKNAFTSLEAAGYWSAFGACGALQALLHGATDVTGELAAIYARIASLLGYYDVARHLSDREWEELLTDVRDWASEAPRSVDDMLARYGAYSFGRAGEWGRSFAYASASDSTWLHFVFEYVDGKVGNRRLRWLFISDSRDHVFEVGGTAPAVGPEQAYRELLIAALHADEARIRGLVVPDERASVLWRRAYPADVAAALAEQYRTMDVIRTPPPEDPRRVYLLSDGYPGPLAVVHDGSSWKVDATPLIESRTPESE